MSLLGFDKKGKVRKRDVRVEKKQMEQDAQLELEEGEMEDMWRWWWWVKGILSNRRRAG